MGHVVADRQDQANAFLQLRDVPDGMRARVKEIAAGFGGAELRICPAESTAG